MTTIVRMLAVMALMLAASLAQAQNKVPSERAKPAYDPAPRVDNEGKLPGEGFLSHRAAAGLFRSGLHPVGWRMEADSPP